MAESVTFEINSQAFVRAIYAFLTATNQDTERWIETLTQRLRIRIMGYTPVDTGRLRNSWRSRKVHATEGRVSTDVEYAPVVEYGGYKGVGPRTVQAGPFAFGMDLVAGPGIYSTQAPGGMVRKAMAEEGKAMLAALAKLHQQKWGH